MTKTRLAIALGLALGAASAAVAQQSTEPAAPASTSPTPASASEMVAGAEKIVARGTNLARTIRDMLDKARREADIIRITCLNDKLTQVDVNLRNAQTRLESLRGAADPDRRRHEHTVLNVLGQKFQVLGLEANQCIGQDLYETGATRVETDVNTDMLPVGEDDPSEPPSLMPAPFTGEITDVYVQPPATSNGM